MKMYDGKEKIASNDDINIGGNSRPQKKEVREEGKGRFNKKY